MSSPGALSQLLERVTSTYESAGDFIFNCQMGRRWTTTGMVSVCLIATAMNLKRDKRMSEIEPDSIIGDYNTIDGPSEEEAYLQGNVLSNQTVQVELTILQENIKSFCGLSVSPPTERRWRGQQMALLTSCKTFRVSTKPSECIIHPLSLFIGAVLSPHFLSLTLRVLMCLLTSQPMYVFVYSCFGHLTKSGDRLSPSLMAKSSWRLSSSSKVSTQQSTLVFLCPMSA